MTEKVYLVLDVKSKNGNTFEIIGVFNDREKAMSACVNHNDFLCELELNKIYPRETTVINGHYPILGG